MRSRRALAAAGLWLVLVFAFMAGTALLQALYKNPGDPALAELRKALSSAPAALFHAELPDARPTDERLLQVPAAWTNGPRRELAPLIVFVDGRRVSFAFEKPDLAIADAPAAYFENLTRRERRLVLRCPGLDCRTAWVTREDLALKLAVARGRLVERASWLAIALLGIVAFALLVRPWLRRLGPLAASALGLTALVSWQLASFGESPQAVPTLVGLLLLMGLALVLRSAGDAASSWLGVLDSAAGRVLVPVLSDRGERWVGRVSIGLAFLLLAPLLLTDQTYFSDWANHLYYVSRQAESLRQLHRPSYFLHSDLSGPFYPYFAFYGSTLYVVAAALSLVLGSLRLGYALTFALGFGMAYAGVVWMGRQAGLPKGLAHLPALVLVSSAYTLTNAYGRGSWAEFVATGSLPLLIAAGHALLFSERLRFRDASLFALAVVFFAGSHTITLVWGGLFLVALAGAALLARPAGLPLPRLLRLFELLVLAGATNAWFLLPAIAYGRGTHIGGYAARGFGSDTLFLNVPSVLFHPGRLVPPESGTPGLYTQVSVYALLWALAAAWWLFSSPRPGGERALRRFTAVLLLILATYLLLIATGRQDLPWTLIPRTLKIIQFHFRLHTYVTLAIVGLVLAGLKAALASERRALWIATLGVAVAVQLALGFYQVSAAPRYFDIQQILASGTRVPPTLLEAHDYRFVNHPDSEYLGEPVARRPEAELRLDPAAVVGDRLDVTLPAGSGPFLTNVAWSPFIAAEGGITIVGRTADGGLLLDRLAGVASPTGRIVAAAPPPVRAGVLVSILAMVTLAGVLARLALRSS